MMITMLNVTDKQVKVNFVTVDLNPACTILELTVAKNPNDPFDTDYDQISITDINVEQIEYLLEKLYWQMRIMKEGKKYEFKV